MDQLTTFQDFLTTQSVEIPVLGFAGNLLLAAFLAYILRIIYIRYGKALSDRESFAGTFVLVTMTTMLIISVVKSSLALSLGLVGALSIVRFRAAIKEPEELAYVFLAIAIGLGLGADQRVITVVAFMIISAIIWMTQFSYSSEAKPNMHLRVTSHNPVKAELTDIARILKTHCSEVELKRLDNTKELLETSFLIKLEGFPQLEAVKSDLSQLGDSVDVTFLDHKGFVGSH